MLRNVIFNFHSVLLVTVILVYGVSSLRSQHSTNSAKGVNTYRFLFWLPVPLRSHHGLFKPLLMSLAEKGHHVTLVTPFPISNPPKNVHQITVDNQYETFSYHTMQTGMINQFLPFLMKALAANYTRKIFEDPKVQEFLKADNHFDALIMETMAMNEAFIALHHKYNAPVIDVLPPANYHWAYYIYGIPYDTSYIVELQAAFSDRMTFWERFQNTLFSLSQRLMIEFICIPVMQDLMDEFIRYPGWENRPPLMDMMRNISLALINTHFSISYPYPMPPNAKEIAGINIPRPKPLPQELQEFMDSGKEGVILFSMGSHLSMLDNLGKEKVEMFKTFFSGLQQKVLWKWESEMFEVPSNVKLTKWFPQTDALGHKNCKLFITHGGFHSLLESIYNGVPMVSIPIMGDQFKNAKIVEYYRLGLKLTVENISKESIEWTINQVLFDDKYKSNAKERSRIYKDTPQSQMDSAIYWIEYVIRHNGAHHLRPAVATMPWYQQNMMDVYAVIVTILSVSLIVIYSFLRFLVKIIKTLCCREKKVKNKRKHD